ncbi:adenylyl-sulfate kinase [Candidatus Nitrospira bockiana]
MTEPVRETNTASAGTPAFAVWISGLPASGKSTITAALVRQLRERGVVVEVLESDAVRRILTPAPTYSAEERALFYRTLAFAGSRLVAHGINVLIDATATKRTYREFAKTLIPGLIEVAVECPLEVCIARDPKGIYRKGLAGEAGNVPGLHDPYEPPLAPDIRVSGETTPPAAAARSILTLLEGRGLVR